MNVFYIGMNNQVSPYDNRMVRQAMALALDRQKIVDVVFPEGYEVASHFAPCAIPFACEGDEWHSFDPQLAKNLLAEAGYPNGFQTELFYRDVLRGYLPNPDLAAEEIRTQLWENLRVNVKVRKVDQDQFIDAVDSGSLEGLYLLGWGADYPDISNFLDYHFGADASLQFGEKNSELVGLLVEGASEISSKGRREIYRKANNIILQDVPMIPVAHGDWYSQDHLAVAYHTNVQNAPVAAFGFETYSDTSVPGKDTFKWMQSEEPISLYCAVETDNDSLRSCIQISETLYKFQNNSAVAVPGLAENCEPNGDLTVWTCDLREGVYFHDNSTLDANDVVMSFWVQWDDTHSIHVGISKDFDYFSAFWGSFTSVK
jgi:peptide/nickel transport system substrate-binding protein